MATALRRRFSYHKRLFLLLLTFSWALVACFVLFQYGREKHFKAERLDAQLQLFNLKLLDALDEGISPADSRPDTAVRSATCASRSSLPTDRSSSTTRSTRCPRPTTLTVPRWCRH